MRWRALFFVSLALNLLIAGAWIGTRTHTPPAGGPLVQESPTIKTNVLVRRQFFSWSQVESPDYPTYIANLRSINCPEQTIRDIIIADVNTLYAQRLATELVTPDQQWWRSRPDTNVARLAAQKTRQADEERRALLTRLLGPKWEAGDLVSLPRPSTPGVALDGPVLGVLPMEVKQTVQDITARSQEKLQSMLTATASLDPAQRAAELARLRRETRDDLARVLSPQQLEEYLLRYSQNANNLRSELGTLGHFNSSPEEFRALFRATDLVDRQLLALEGRNDPNAILERNNLLQQRESALRTALGAERYQQLVSLRDPLYRESVSTAQNNDSPASAPTIYQINQATAQELEAIRSNTNLTAMQRAIAVKETELRQLTANALALGQEVSEPAAEEPPLTPPLPIDIAELSNVRRHSYRFEVGDTVGSIAQRYGVSLQDLQSANPTLNIRGLKAGDTLNIPDKAQQ